MRSYILQPNGSVTKSTVSLTSNLLSSMGITADDYSDIDYLSDVYFGDSEVFLCSSISLSNCSSPLSDACKCVLDCVCSLKHCIPTNVATISIYFSNSLNLYVQVFGSDNYGIGVTYELYVNSCQLTFYGYHDLRYLYRKVLDLYNITNHEVFMEVHSIAFRNQLKDILCLKGYVPKQPADKFIITCDSQAV